MIILATEIWIYLIHLMNIPRPQIIKIVPIHVDLLGICIRELNIGTLWIHFEIRPNFLLFSLIKKTKLKAAIGKTFCLYLFPLMTSDLRFFSCQAFVQTLMVVIINQLIHIVACHVQAVPLMAVILLLIAADIQPTQFSNIEDLALVIIIYLSSYKFIILN